MIKAVIFDMDGLLIDSEPLWQQAEIDIFGKVGIELDVETTKQTMGLRTNEVVEYWHRKQPWDNPSQAEIADQIDNRVIELVRERGKPMAGVDKALAICEARNLPIALASSSSLVMITAVLDKLGIADKMQVIQTAHDETYGKPHPAVYITTAEKLGVAPADCLAFEDSPNGVLAAKAAKMACIAIPEPENRNDKRFGIADMILHSLNDFSDDILNDWQ